LFFIVYHFQKTAKETSVYTISACIRTLFLVIFFLTCTTLHAEIIPQDTNLETQQLVVSHEEVQDPVEKTAFASPDFFEYIQSVSKAPQSPNFTFGSNGQDQGVKYRGRSVAVDDSRFNPQALNQRNLLLLDAETPLCPKAELIVWWKADHIGGNRDGLLNEDTRGKGLRCYSGRLTSVYAEYGTLINSNRGETTLTGIGAHYVVADSTLLFFAVNYTWYYVSYEIPKYKATVWGYVKVPSFAFGYHYDKKVEITWNVLPVPLNSAPGSGKPKRILLLFGGVSKTF
jgi:hypothetical protein